MDAAGGCLHFLVHTSASRRDTSPPLFLSLSVSLSSPPSKHMDPKTKADSGIAHVIRYHPYNIPAIDSLLTQAREHPIYLF